MRQQKIKNRISQKHKKETSSRKRVNSCPRSHQKKKNNKKIRILKSSDLMKLMNCSQAVQTTLWTTSVKIMET